MASGHGDDLSGAPLRRVYRRPAVHPSAPGAEHRQLRPGGAELEPGATRKTLEDDANASER